MEFLACSSPWKRPTRTEHIFFSPRLFISAHYVNIFFLFDLYIFSVCLAGFPLSRASWSSSERAPPAPPAPPAQPADAADAVRDAKLYPVLSADDTTDVTDTTHASDSTGAPTEHATDVRTKRSSGQDWERAPKVSRVMYLSEFSSVNSSFMCPDHT